MSRTVATPEVGGTGQATLQLAIDALANAGGAPSSGDVLTYNGTHWTKATPAGGGGGGGLGAFQSKNGTYSIQATDGILVADTGSAWSATLPAASAYAGKELLIEKTTSDFNALTVLRAGSDTIVDVSTGLTSTKLHTQGESIRLVSDGTATWYVINRKIPSRWLAYTPTFVGFGTVSGIDVVWRRVGDSIELGGKYILGTVTGVTATMSLPGTLAVDNSGKVANVRALGRVTRANSTGSELTFSAVGNDTTLKYGFIFNGTSAPSTQILGNVAGGAFTGDTHWISACVIPIDGWNG